MAKLPSSVCFWERKEPCSQTNDVAPHGKRSACLQAPVLRGQMYSTGPVHGLQVGISARPGRDGNEGNKKGSSPTSHRILEQNHVQETTCKRDPLASLAKTWRPFPVTALLTRALHTIQQTQSTPQHGRTHTKKHRPPYPRPAPSENAGLSRSFTIFAKLIEAAK